MANRVVTDVSAEEIIYGTWLDDAGFNTAGTRVQVGDIIIDTRTSTVDGLASIYENDVDVAFSTARNGCTVWIDCNSMGVLRQFQFATVSGVPWVKADTEPVTFRPIAAQCEVHMNTSSTRSFNIDAMRLLIIDGESDLYPGLRSPFTTSNFLTGTFGFFFSGEGKDTGGMNLQILCDDDNFDFNVRGVEAIDLFAGIRVMLGGSPSFDHEGSLTIRRCYRHDSINGEGIYIGYTGLESNGTPRFIVDITDNLFIRTAAESMQIQHTLAGSYVERNTNVMCAADWIRPFQAFQSNGWQQVFLNGDITMRNNITEGWGTNAMNLFGSGTLTDPSPTGTVRWINSYFGNGGDKFLYRQASLDQGLTIHFEDLIINDMDDHLLDRPDKAAAGKNEYFASSNNGTDTWKFKDIVSTDDKANFFEDFTTNTEEQINFTIDNTLPIPDYIGIGITVAEYRGTWHERWFANELIGNSILSVADNGSGDAMITVNNVHYCNIGDFVIITDTTNYDGYHQIASVPTTSTFDVTGLSYVATETGKFGKVITYSVGEVIQFFTISGFPDKGFYKVILNHTPTSTTDDPPSNPLNYEKLYWDVNGVRSDDVSYTGTPDPSTGGNYPPDNALLNTDDKYFKLGMGVGQQENDPRYSKFKWYKADDAIGTNKQLIYGAKDLTFDINDDRWTWVKRQTGKYVVGSITPVDDNGLTGTEVFATGVII